jgi:S1-C subfamily serine protease
MRLLLTPLFWLCVSTVSAAVGDPQIRSDHPWYPGELSCSTFERLFKTQAQAARQLGAESGVLVALVSPDGPAAMAGISAGDLVVEVNRKRATDVDTVRSTVAGVGEGGQVLLKVQRGESARLIAVRI